MDQSFHWPIMEHLDKPFAYCCKNFQKCGPPDDGLARPSKPRPGAARGPRRAGPGGLRAARPMLISNLDPHLTHIGNWVHPESILGPTGISIGSAIFAGLEVITDRPTDGPCYSICSNRPHLRCGIIRHHFVKMYLSTAKRVLHKIQTIGNNTLSRWQNWSINW